MRTRLTAFAFSVLCLFALMGCSNDTTDTEMPAQTQNIGTASAEDNTEATDVTSVEESTTSVQSDSTNYDFSSYETEIEQITKEINNAQVSSDYSENYETFYNLKQKLDAIDDELDSLDDTFEYQYKSGDITGDEYRTLERTIENLEDELDFAEDTLENKFNIDD